MAITHKRYQLQQSEGSDTGSKEKTMWQRTWKLNVKGKIRIFIWTCHNAILSTSANLHRRGWQIDEICRICRKAPETLEHLFFHCRSAKLVWKLSPVQWDGLQLLEHFFPQWWENCAPLIISDTVKKG